MNRALPSWVTYPAEDWITISPAEAGLAQLVTVELAADVQDLGYVTVLLQTPQDEAPVGPDSPFPQDAP